MDDLRKDVFFIKKGIVRLFKINDKGDEITIDIRWENQFIASRDALLFNKSAQFFCKTLEPTEVLHIDYEALISRDPQLEALVKFIYQILAEPLTRLDSFLLRTPEERYVDYVKSNPDILGDYASKRAIIEITTESGWNSQDTFQRVNSHTFVISSFVDHYEK